jgi:hypothetical protein
MHKRIMMGNKASYANSNLISRSSKLQIYHTLVRAVVTCGSDSWTLTVEEETTLAIFERNILRKIYGPVKENELWRVRRNEELKTIIKEENIVRFIKCQRIRWLGHIERMQDTAIPKKMIYRQLYVTRRVGRPRMRWLDDVSMNLRKIGVSRWRAKQVTEKPGGIL